MPLPKKKIRPPFMDSKTLNRADTVIRDFTRGNRALNTRSIGADIQELMSFRNAINKLFKKGVNRTSRDRENMKIFESRIRATLKDIASKKAKLLKQDVFSKSPNR